MSFDEVFSLHERLIAPLSALLRDIGLVEEVDGEAQEARLLLEP